MVAHLLELGHGGQHQPPALDAFLSRLDLGHHVRDGRLIERRLLGGQIAPDFHLLLLRQVRDDRFVGLEPPQDERPGEPFEPLRDFLVGAPLDRDGIPLPELLGRPEQPWVGKFHDRPQVAQPVLHRRPGQRDPGPRGQPAHRLGLPGRMVLDVLRLVADNPPPRNLRQILQVPCRDPVGGDHQIGRRQRLGKLVPAQPIPTVMHVNLQSRSELGCLLFPIAHQTHRANKKRGLHYGGGVDSVHLRRTSFSQTHRAVLPLVSHQPEQLDGLSQTHRIRQNPPQTKPIKEGQPGKPTLLVGAQGAGERGGGGYWGEAAVGLAGEQVAEPAVSVHLDQGQVVVAGGLQTSQQGVTGRRSARPASLQEFQRGPQVPVVQLHPLPAQPYQRDLEPGQLGQFGGIELLVPDGQVVAEVDQIFQPELGVGHRTGGRRPGARRQLEPQPGLAHPVRQQHPEPGPRQQRCRLLQKTERALGIQGYLGRCGSVQRGFQLGKQPHRPAEPGQQFFLRVPDPHGEPGRGHPRPHVIRRHQQAGIVCGLQGEFNPPVGPPAVIFHIRLHQPETGPHRPSRKLRSPMPFIELNPKLSNLRLILGSRDFDDRIGSGQRRQPPAPAPAAAPAAQAATATLPTDPVPSHQPPHPAPRSISAPSPPPQPASPATPPAFPTPAPEPAPRHRHPAPPATAPHTLLRPCAAPAAPAPEPPDPPPISPPPPDTATTRPSRPASPLPPHQPAAQPPLHRQIPAPAPATPATQPAPGPPPPTPATPPGRPWSTATTRSARPQPPSAPAPPSPQATPPPLQQAARCRRHTDAHEAPSTRDQVAAKQFLAAQSPRPTDRPPRKPKPRGPPAFDRLQKRPTTKSRRANATRSPDTH